MNNISDNVYIKLGYITGSLVVKMVTTITHGNWKD